MLLSSKPELMRPSQNADTMGRYYTSDEVSAALVRTLAPAKPKLVIELGAGRAALANAAARAWTQAHFVTVEKDQDATAVLQGHASHIHHVHDVLDEKLSDGIGLSLGSVDVGLCNPPYVRPRWKEHFGNILEDAGLSGSLKSIHDAGADLLFIAQNLRLLKNQGKLGLILPDGLITGERYLGVRSALLHQHQVESVVQLPRRVFSRTEAQTYLLVLSKKAGETQSVALNKMEENGVLSPPIFVNNELARIRLDYAYHTATSGQAVGKAYHREDSSTVESLISDLFRGSISSNQLSEFDFPIFHLGDFPRRIARGGLPTVPDKFLINEAEALGLGQFVRYAKSGDVLIARIGRNLHEKAVILRHGFCVVSDCVFVLRPRQSQLKTLESYFASEECKATLGAVSHGVGAKYITRTDVLKLRLPAQ